MSLNPLFTTFPAPDRSQQATPGAGPSTSTPAQRGRPTGAKRGRKPRGAAPGPPPPNASHNAFITSSQQQQQQQDIPAPSTSYSTPLHWPTPSVSGPQTIPYPPPMQSTSVTQSTNPALAMLQPSQSQQRNSDGTFLTLPGLGPVALPQSVATNIMGPPGMAHVVSRPVGMNTLDDDGEGEDELLPAMADDDYSAQLSFQTQSKDNLKVLMENFTPEQYDRFEAYRRHALPKQAVRKVIQQLLGQQVSQPIAQVVAGVAKVFVGEIVEKARAVQQRRGDLGPLSPDHLREAYRAYQLETGRVGSARPLKGKRLFVR